MIGNLHTATVDQFIKGTLGIGTPGNYLAVVSEPDEAARLRDLLWVEMQKMAENGDYVIEEINPLVNSSDQSSKMEAKLPEGKTGIALYKELCADNHDLSLLKSDCVPKNWMVFDVLCDGGPEEEVSAIWRKLKHPFTIRVTL